MTTPVHHGSSAHCASIVNQETFAMPPVIERIDHVVMNTHDVEVTASWYEKVLGFEREIYGPESRLALRFGEQKFNLRPKGASEWVTCPVKEPGALDLCFITRGPISAMVEHLKTCGVPIFHGPAQQPGALGPMMSVYFRDPDGNLVEVASYDDPGAPAAA